VALLLIETSACAQASPKAAEDLLEIIMRRYERASTLLTSNRPVEDWGKLLVDVAAVSAAPVSVPLAGLEVSLTGRISGTQEVQSGLLLAAVPPSWLIIFTSQFLAYRFGLPELGRALHAGRMRMRLN
jgi:hypothetical protein